MNTDEANESAANALCKACGLCCTGHLFIWAKLRPSELDPAEEMGLTVFRSDPRQRGFSQPCPLWKDQCTIYASTHYPYVCRAYKCKLLKEVIGEHVSLQDALTHIQQAQELIRGLEGLLPRAPGTNFRERLVARLEHPDEFVEQANADLEFRQKAEELLSFYESVFGVKDLVERPE